MAQYYPEIPGEVYESQELAAILEKRARRRWWDRKFKAARDTVRVLGRRAPLLLFLDPSPLGGDDVGSMQELQERYLRGLGVGDLPQMPTVPMEWLRPELPTPQPVVIPAAPVYHPTVETRGRTTRIRLPAGFRPYMEPPVEFGVPYSEPDWAPALEAALEPVYERGAVTKLSLAVSPASDGWGDLDVTLRASQGVPVRGNDGKSRSERQLMSFNRFVNRTWGRVDEALDLYEAVVWNVYVGGRPLGAIDLVDLPVALRELELEVDGHGIMVDLAVNEVVDRAIGRLSREADAGALQLGLQRIMSAHSKVGWTFRQMEALKAIGG